MFIRQLNPRFTDAEKESCIPVIRRIIELSYLSRRNGLLALEAGISEEKSVFLKSGIELLLCDVGIERVEYFLQKLILAGNYSGSQLLERLLIMDGIFDIWRGYAPDHIALDLLSIMGEEYLPRIKEIIPDI